MSETLFVEWDRDRLIAATGRAESSGTRVTSAVVVDRKDGSPTPSEVGTRLQSALSAASIAASDAVAVFPRQLVTFHRLTLPNLSDDELPDIVRLQAATRLTASVDSVCLDFTPLPVDPGSETRDVLLVTLPQRHLQDVKTVLSVCGLELSSVRVSSFEIAASADRAGLVGLSSDSAAVDVVLSLRTDSIEMTFMQGHSVVFSHSGASWTSTDNVEQAVRAEISRSRMAAAEDLGEYRVSTLTVIGSDSISGLVPDSISRRLNDAPVVRVEPRDRLVSGFVPETLKASDMVALAGAIVRSASSRVPSVDLINPRETPEKQDYSRLRNIAIAGIVALAVAGGWSWRAATIRNLESETSAIRKKASEMRQEYKDARKTDLLLYSRLTEWSDRDISWVGELQRLQQLMEGTERIYIRSVECNERKGDNLAVVHIEGFAKDRRDVEDFSRVLNEAGYDVAPTEIPPNLRDPEYAYLMSLEVIIPASRDSSKS